MNLINYNQAIEALEKERQLLLNREQYGAENVLVHHAINVIVELPIIRQPEIVRCKDCKCWENGLCKSDDVSRKIDDCDVTLILEQVPSGSALTEKGGEAE